MSHICNTKLCECEMKVIKCKPYSDTPDEEYSTIKEALKEFRISITVDEMIGVTKAIRPYYMGYYWVVNKPYLSVIYGGQIWHDIWALKQIIPHQEAVELIIKYMACDLESFLEYWYDDDEDWDKEYGREYYASETLSNPSWREDWREEYTEEYKKFLSKQNQPEQ